MGDYRMNSKDFLFQLVLVGILAFLLWGLFLHTFPAENREMASTILGAILYALNVEVQKNSKGADSPKEQKQ